MVLSVPTALAPRELAPELRRLADLAPLALLGASPVLADALGASAIGEDPIGEARRASISVAPGSSPLE